MKILLLSDLHQHSIKIFNTIFNHLPKEDKYDIVVIAGDTSNGDLNLLEQIVNKFKKPVYFVFGNHCYINLDIQNAIKFCLDRGLNLLYGCNNFKITHNNKTYTLIGGTGWSSFELYNEYPKNFYKQHAQNSVIDFSKVFYKNRIVTPDLYETFHNKEWNYYLQFKNRENVILITHFPMSDICLDPYFSQPVFKDLNPYFINNKDTSGFKLILSGHTHTCIDAKDKYGCHHIINAYGYGSEFQRIIDKGIRGANGFSSYKIINVDDYL